jgi:putative transcriptional regulator
MTANDGTLSRVLRKQASGLVRTTASMIRFTPSNQASPRAGNVLLSEPFLDDPYFGRKVVLLCEHNEEGSFGFVLNNFVDIDVDEVMDDLPKLNTRISVGGPVKNGNLYYLHTRAEIAESIEVVDGVYMGGDFDQIRDLLRSHSLTSSEIRFFIGYSGWSPAQLEEEIRSRSWFVADVERQDIMRTDEENESFWKRLISSMGDGFTHIANAPSDPSLN